MAMLFGFSSLSNAALAAGRFSYYDVHFAAYAGLAVLTARALAKGRLRNVSWRAVLRRDRDLVGCTGSRTSTISCSCRAATSTCSTWLADAIGSVVGRERGCGRGV